LTIPAPERCILTSLCDHRQSATTFGFC
jgi:hypothetical protein